MSVILKLTYKFNVSQIKIPISVLYSGAGQTDMKAPIEKNKHARKK